MQVKVMTSLHQAHLHALPDTVMSVLLPQVKVKKAIYIKHAADLAQLQPVSLLLLIMTLLLLLSPARQGESGKI
jgi:hypothetical protein